MACGDFKDLPKRTASDKVSHDKAFNIANSPKYDGYQHELSSMVYKCFNKKSSRDAVTCAYSETLATRDKSAIKNKIMSNQ